MTLNFIHHCILLKNEELFKVSSDNLQSDAESDTPSHRHLIVFSYRALYSYLKLAGFKQIRGYGFGLYPFPNTIQPILEKIDPSPSTLRGGLFSFST